MEEKSNYGVKQLIVIIIIFLCSVSFLHTTKKYKPYSLIAGSYVVEDIDRLSIQQCYTYIDTLLQSHNVHLISQAIGQLSKKKVVIFMRMLLGNKQSQLSVDEKIDLIFYLVMHYSDKHTQWSLLNMVCTQKEYGIPLLIRADKETLRSIIPLVLDWSRQFTPPHIFSHDTMVFEAYLYTVIHNDREAFESLIGNNVPINDAVAQQLLRYIQPLHNRTDFMTLIAQAPIVRDHQPMDYELLGHNEAGMLHLLLGKADALYSLLTHMPFFTKCAYGLRMSCDHTHYVV